ncbi:MAG: hypothetical protein GAK35_02978 [Herbaspirillum frisingense]|uniref:Uncharacterized protein n=1 Tax=Herbaspirillum frisingense TaxID=92645 RepID=A0A7V8JTK0_9BURK|nr:MAG: hypothetical protein GAK35_02978 [Herbaspirillum frisingense]
MKKSLLRTAILLSSAATAQAETVLLDGDIGCESTKVQQSRVQMTRVIMTADNAQTKDQVTRELVDLTSKNCVPLSGIFTVQGRERGLLKINTKEGAQLWLVE